MNEIWKDVKGYGGHYQVSNLGNSRSLDRKIKSKNGVIKNLKGRNITITDNGNGYKKIGFYIKGHQHYIHRLVLSTFKPMENMENLQVNHKDGDKNNNKLDNLEWVTDGENKRHSYDTGLHKKGDNHVQCKTKSSDIVYIRKNYIPYHCEFSGASLAKKFGLSKCQISRIVNNKRRTEI